MLGTKKTMIRSLTSSLSVGTQTSLSIRPIQAITILCLLTHLLPISIQLCLEDMLISLAIQPLRMREVQSFSSPHVLF